jgi:hypothetical protein
LGNFKPLLLGIDFIIVDYNGKIQNVLNTIKKLKVGRENE